MVEPNEKAKNIGLGQIEMIEQGEYIDTRSLWVMRPAAPVAAPGGQIIGDTAKMRRQARDGQHE